MPKNCFSKIILKAICLFLIFSVTGLVGCKGPDEEVDISTPTHEEVAPLESFYSYDIKRIDLLGHDCVYIDEGRGTPVIFLHGFSVNLNCFSPIYPSFMKNRRVIALDYPGYYLSEKKEDVPYDIPYAADAVVELIDKLNLENVVLVGSSMGGGVAMEVALKDPDSISAVILADPVGFSGRNPFLAAMISLQVSLLPEEIVRMKMFDRLISRVDTFFYDKEDPFADIITDWYYAMEERDDFGIWISILTKMARSVLRADYRKTAGDIKAPTYIIWGDKDEVLPPEGLEIADEAMGENLKVEMMPNVGHLPFVEDPETFNAKTDEFLKSLGL